MIIIKEVWKDRRPEMKEHIKDRIIIRSNCYGSSIGYINKLVEQAKKDFKGIDVDSIKVVCYGGRRYAGTFGIEFDVPPDTYMLIGYDEVSNTELIAK